MKPTRIRYSTMNSWNGQTAPAYNLKVHKVIPNSLQSKVFELMDCENFYDEINFLKDNFAEHHEFKWQAGFNGRSGGYLVLYRGEKKPSQYKSVCKDCGQRNFQAIENNGARCGKCGNLSRINRTMYDISISGAGIEDNEVPKEVMKSFTELANDIVNSTIQKAKECNVKEETYTVTKTRKVIA
jgi:DNA-directed RNA polymerase subunit M/transcription elongation factor TFIIS